MKISPILLLIFLFIFSISLSSCNGNLAHSKIKRPEKPGKTEKIEVAYWSRVTYYHAYEDKWGAKVASHPKMRNKAGFGVAAHPDFAFYTNIRIPELKGKLDGDDKFQIIDRGSAVTKKTASNGKKYVFDVFVPRDKMREFARKMPQYTWVIVEE